MVGYNNGQVIVEIHQGNLGVLKRLKDEQKKNPEIMFEAIKKWPSALLYCHEDLLKNEEFMMKIIKMRPDVSQYFDVETKNGPFMLEAIKRNPSCLRFAGDTYRNNKEFVKKLIQVDPVTLCGASQTLRGDLELILTAISMCPHGGSKEVKQKVKKVGEDVYLSPINRIVNDKLEVTVTQVVTNKPLTRILSSLNPELLKDPEVMKKLIEANPAVAKFVSPEGKVIKEIVVGQPLTSLKTSTNTYRR